MGEPTTDHVIELHPADKMDTRGWRQAFCRAGDWHSDLGPEAMVRSDGSRHRHEATYPEHHKLEQVKDKSQAIGEFLDRGPYRICELVCVRCGDTVTSDKDCCSSPHEQYLPLRKSIDRLLAEYFGIDLGKIDQEKRAMLAEIRRHNREGDPGGDW